MPGAALSRIGVILLACSLSGCIARLPEKPALRVGAADFRQRIHTLCLLPARLQIAIPDKQTTLERLELDITDKLKGAGYAVVGPQQTADLYNQALTAQSGAYDPHSGERDSARYEATRAQARQALKVQLGCDATVSVTLALVSVPFMSGKATWDGVSYSFGNYDSTGWISGLSLWIAIHDLDNQELYFNTGGIETLATLETGFFSSEFKPIDTEQLLVDQTRLLQAINLALGPLLAPAASPPPVS